MVLSENRVITASLLAGLCGLIILGTIEVVFGLPGQWVFVIAFLLLVLFGAILPQLYLLKIDQSVPSASRLGVITLVLIVLAGQFSGGVIGIELMVIWALVGITIVLVVITELRKGYRESGWNGNQ